MPQNLHYAGKYDTLARIKVLVTELACRTACTELPLDAHHSQKLA